MDSNEAKKLVSETGMELVGKKLVARTWGNISARVDKTHFAISPSGLAYDIMTPEDVPVYDMENESYEGLRKPSSEKKIHAAAYRVFDDVNFVIHTHQDYATAVGLVGTDIIEMTAEEKALLGEIRVAGYGLPGTGGLKKNVEKEMLAGSKVVLMLHHGAVICAADRAEAVRKAEVLEKVCKRVVDKHLPNISASAGRLSETFLIACKDAVVISDPEVKAIAEGGNFRCQIDDIAQMIGSKIRVVPGDDMHLLRGLNRQDLVLVKGVGAVIFTEDPDDAEALSMLIRKSAICKLLTDSMNRKRALSGFDCTLMRFVYKKKYSKQKGAAHD
ncbi:MAG: class II aldolase/adducin family protein [Lachnospiraceae bacterium]|nr:class II aldolase/adducin family protein [Lachnospiraceae bacterium]